MIKTPDELYRLRDIIASGGPFLGFDRSFVPRRLALEIIDRVIEALPEEMRLAQELVLDSEGYLEKARIRAGEIEDEAVRRAERMVDADVITQRAREKAKELLREADGYVVSRLRDLEDELLRLLDEVRAGIRVVSAGEHRKHAADETPAAD